MENEKKYPPMCGGVFSTILLSYRKDKSQTGTADPLNQNNFLRELARVVNPGIIFPPDSTLKSAVSRYLNCRKGTSTTLPFEKTSYIESFKKQMKESYPVLLARMNRFLDTFIDITDPSVREPLTREMYEILGNDPVCRRSSLLLLPDGEAITFRNLGDIHFQSFLLGIWFYILSHQVSNVVEKELFDDWKKSKRGRFRLPGKVILQEVAPLGYP